jgi:flavin reductase (DIM6/NTAB) family NADH-FMN oxidoreductase RutF
MKVTRGSYPLLYPIPICLLGSLVDSVPNYEAVGNIGMVSFNPNLIMVSSIKAHHTNTGINTHGTFSVNYPNAEQVKETDYCGTYSGKKVDKSKLFTNFYGVLKTAPMITECPVNLECRVVETLHYGAYDVWIGEVVETYLDEAIAPADPKQWPTINQVNPLVYSPASEYYNLGKQIGKGYQEAKKLNAPR